MGWEEGVMKVKHASFFLNCKWKAQKDKYS